MNICSKIGVGDNFPHYSLTFHSFHCVCVINRVLDAVKTIALV